MAKISLDALEQFTNNSQEKGRVGFFNLKADGEEAVVRFLVDSLDDMDILTIHELQSAGKYIKVSCNREIGDGIDKCPLCANGTKLTQKVYIKMLQYSADESGNVVCSPVIWERSPQYAVKLREYLNNYGPLSDIICKVIRHGGRGDLKTSYEIVPNLSKVVYPDSKFVKDASAFANYRVIGTIVKEKTADEMRTFIATGSFPQKAQQNQQMNVVMDERFGNTGFVQTNDGFAYTGSDMYQSTQPQTTNQIPQQKMPWQQTQQIQRPIRTY